MDLSWVWRVEAWNGVSWEFIGWAHKYERALEAVRFARTVGVLARLREA